MITRSNDLFLNCYIATNTVFFTTMNIIYAAVLAALLAYLRTIFETRKAKRSLYKQRISIVVRLLEESLILCKERNDLLRDLIKKLEKDDQDLLGVNYRSDNSLKQLVQRLNTDDYHTAFNVIFHDVINWENLFYQLRGYTTRCFDRHNHAEKAYKENYDSYFFSIEEYQKKAELMKLEWVKLQIKKGGLNLPYKLYSQLSNDFRNSYKGNDHTASILTYHDTFIEKMKGIIEAHESDGKLEFLSSYVVLDYEFKLMFTRNRSLALTLNNEVESMEHETRVLTTLFKQLQSSLMRPLYQ